MIDTVASLTLPALTPVGQRPEAQLHAVPVVVVAVVTAAVKVKLCSISPLWNSTLDGTHVVVGVCRLRPGSSS